MFDYASERYYFIVYAQIINVKFCCFFSVNGNGFANRFTASTILLSVRMFYDFFLLDRCLVSMQKMESMGFILEKVFRRNLWKRCYKECILIYK